MGKKLPETATPNAGAGTQRIQLPRGHVVTEPNPKCTFPVRLQTCRVSDPNDAHTSMLFLGAKVNTGNNLKQPSRGDDENSSSFLAVEWLVRLVALGAATCTAIIPAGAVPASLCTLMRPGPHSYDGNPGSIILF